MDAYPQQGRSNQPMALYFITALSNPDKVIAAAKQLVSARDFHKVADDKFFLSFNGTTVELGEKLGINEGRTGMGILLRVTAFHGRAPKSIWEFIGLQLNKT